MSNPTSAWQRGDLAIVTAENVHRYPLANPPTGASYCPDGEPHHWLIDAPSGFATSMGVCRKCGLERQHKNSIENDITWSDLSPIGQRALRREAS